MKTKKLILFATTVMAFSLMLLFTGCAKPPTEQVAALQSDLAACKAQGADVFAQADYNKVTQKMSSLQGFMDSKKYRQATALADSLAMDMTALKNNTAANAKKVGAMAVSSVDGELAKLKNMMTPEDAKLLGAEEMGKCQEQLKSLDDKAAALKTELGNSAYLNVYNSAKPLLSEIAMVAQDHGQKVEKAKALEAEKAAKSKSKKGAVKAAAKPAVKSAAKAAAKPAAKKAAKKK